MASRYYSAVAQDTTITSGITSSSTTVVVGSTTGYPASFPFVLALDYNTASEELVTVTAVAGLTLTITRGYNGTTAQAHATGAVVRHVITAQDLTDAQTHYGTALSAGAHGVTGALATFLGTSTSANFAALVTDETGSGSLVFGTSPTIASPTITGTINAGGSTGPSGQFLSSTGTGIAWSTPSAANLGFNAQTGTTYTLVAGDANKLVTLSNASGITLTIPSATFTTGQQINIQQIGAGQVTVQGDGTSTFTGTGTKLRAQYSAATIVCTASNTFTLIGDLA
jgi:hypothetical protein